MNQVKLMTKIICTIGTASADPQILTHLIRGGMNVARLNFSHSTPDEHFETLQNIRKISGELGKIIAVMQDLPGPKLRVGNFALSPVQLNPGEQFILTSREVTGNNQIVSVNQPILPLEVKPGDSILLKDGAIKLEVLSVQDQDIICQIINGGELGDHQGINLPGVRLSIPALTEADKEYLKLGLEWGIDFVAMSFVRSADDVLGLKEFIAETGYNSVPVIAKLEKPQAIEHLESIIRVADGVMVARGDLGIEMPVEQVPMLQKKIITQANRMGKLVITATQMLESMIHSPRPTRAEASDVANSILDGTDAVMLSGETAVGEYPVETLNTMVNIIQATEDAVRETGGFKYEQLHPELEITDAVCHSAELAATQIQARAIIAFTQSGYTARLISKYRPITPIITFTTSLKVQRQMSLYWGIESLLMAQKNKIENLIETAICILKKQERIKPGDRVVFILGSPVSQSGITNLMKVHEVA